MPIVSIIYAARFFEILLKTNREKFISATTDQLKCFLKQLTKFLCFTVIKR